MPGGWRGSLSIHSQTPARLSSPICPLSLYHLPPSQPQHTHTHMASKQAIHTRHASRTANSHSHMAHTSQNTTQNFCAQLHTACVHPTQLAEKTILDQNEFSQRPNQAWCSNAANNNISSVNQNQQFWTFWGWNWTMNKLIWSFLLFLNNIYIML